MGGWLGLLMFFVTANHCGVNAGNAATVVVYC
jgi:hypothetical protein